MCPELDAKTTRLISTKHNRNSLLSALFCAFEFLAIRGNFNVMAATDVIEKIEAMPRPQFCFDSLENQNVRSSTRNYMFVVEIEYSMTSIIIKTGEPK